MSYAELWHPAVQNLLLHLEAGVVGPTTKWFPDRDEDDKAVDWIARFRARKFRDAQRQEPLSHGQMLRDLLCERFDKTLEKHKFTNQILVLAKVEWASRNMIRGFQLQVFVTADCDLEDLALCDDEAACTRADVHYYRCECDLAAPGPIFAEPFPHVHTRAQDEPRFPFPIALSDNPILSFLEFIFMNHAYDIWWRWARRVCAGRGDMLDDLDEMENVHKAGCSGENTDARLGTPAIEKLDRIRKALWEVKQESFPWVLDSFAGHALSYWSRPFTSPVR